MLRKIGAIIFVGIFASSAAYAVCIIHPATVAINHALGIVTGEYEPCEGGLFRPIFRIQPILGENAAVEVKDATCGSENEAREILKRLGRAELVKKGFLDEEAVALLEKLVDPARASFYHERVKVRDDTKAISLEYDVKLARRYDAAKAEVRLNTSISKSGADLLVIEEAESLKGRMGARLVAGLQKEVGIDFIDSGKFSNAGEALKSAAEKIGICRDLCHGAGPDGLKMCIMRALY